MFRGCDTFPWVLKIPLPHGQERCLPFSTSPSEQREPKIKFPTNKRTHKDSSQVNTRQEREQTHNHVKKVLNAGSKRNCLNAESNACTACPVPYFAPLSSTSDKCARRGAGLQHRRMWAAMAAGTICLY
eukprot:4669452-Amphidinium_carterae.1